MPNVSQILIRGVDTQTKSFLQGWRVGRELSPFIAHLVVDDHALIRLREIDRFSNLMLGHNQRSCPVRGPNIPNPAARNFPFSPRDCRRLKSSAVRWH